MWVCGKKCGRQVLRILLRQYTKCLVALFVFICLLFPAFAVVSDVPIQSVLPFDPVSTQTLRASPKKACAIWHNWPISVDNKPAEEDLYQTKEIYPTSGPYVDVGGRMRQRP